MVRFLPFKSSIVEVYSDIDRNFIETRDTQLKVLVGEETGGEYLTKVNLLLVDDRSATMTTSDVLIEEEEIIKMNTNHVGLARFADDNGHYCHRFRSWHVLANHC